MNRKADKAEKATTGPRIYGHSPSQLSCRGYKKSDCGSNILADHLCKNCRAQKFEDDVGEIFTLMGFTVSQNSLIGGRQVDLCASYQQGVVKVKAIVECKFHRSDYAGVDDVSQAIAQSAAPLRNREIDKAYLVSTKGFTAPAKANAADNGVECFTYDELLSSLIDFKPYLKHLIDSFERDHLRYDYVDLKISRLLLHTGWNKHQTTWKPVKQRLLRYMRRWAQMESADHISILGDFGSGKTSSSLYLSYLCARRYLDNPTSNLRIPLLIRLSRHARLERGSIQALVTDFLVNECGVRTDYRAFQKFCQAGKLLLVLDGFDEMAMQVDSRTRVRNFELISELVEKPNKVVLTGRPGYFPTLKEIGTALGRHPEKEETYERVAREIAEAVAQPLSFDILRLEPFSARQIKRFLDRQAGSQEQKSELERILDSSHNLRDLASRPVLLDIIVQSVPKLKHETEINMNKLYSVYTNFWVERDWKKGEMRRLISREERLLFMRELATQMFKEGLNYLHYKELPGRLLSHFRIESDMQLDYFDHDVRTCSFLVRDDEGGYRFSHKSFMEFFFASSVAGEVQSGKHDLLGSLHLSDEVIAFIAEALEPEAIMQLIQDLPEGGNPTFNSNVIRLTLKARNSTLEGLDLTGSNLQCLLLSDCTFYGCTLDRTNLSWSSLSGVKFNQCSLKSSSFEGAKLHQVRFEQCILRKATFRRARFHSGHLGALSLKEKKGWRYYISGGGAYFGSCDMTRSVLRGKYFFNANFDENTLTGANLQNTTFVKCSFRDTKFAKCNLNGATFIECAFARATFLESYMRGIKFVVPVGKIGFASPQRFRSSNFEGALFQDCDLRQSLLVGQNLHQMRIVNIRIDGSRVIGTTLHNCQVDGVACDNVVLVGCRLAECMPSNVYGIPASATRVCPELESLLHSQ